MGKEKKSETFMKEMPVHRLVVTLSLPMALSMLVNSLYNIIDSYYIAGISEEAMTALSLLYPLQNLINAVLIGFSIGISSSISFFLGAEDADAANRAAVTGFCLNAVHGIVLAVLCISIMPAFLTFYSADAVTADYAVRYARIAFSFALLNSCQLSMEKIYQSTGKMTVTMLCMLTGCISNIILDPLLIFGIGPFPKMGIEGAAVATGFGQTIAFVIYIILYLTQPFPLQLGLKNLAFRRDLTLRMYAVGIPAMLNLGLPSLMISALNGILAAFSQSYVLVLGVYYKLQTFLYMPSNGIVQGIRPLVGYNYGAKEYSRVRQIYRTALVFSMLIMAFGTVLCLAVPGQLFGLFTSTQESLQIGVMALRTICAGFIVSSISLITCGTLEGLGKGNLSLIVSLMRYAVIILPAAWILSRIIGASGVWHAFWIAEWVTAGVSFVIYRKKIVM